MRTRAPSLLNPIQVHVVDIEVVPHLREQEIRPDLVYLEIRRQLDHSEVPTVGSEDEELGPVGVGHAGGRAILLLTRPDVALRIRTEPLKGGEMGGIGDRKLPSKPLLVLR